MALLWGMPRIEPGESTPGPPGTARTCLDRTVTVVRMTRPRPHRLGGVCAGFAEHTGLPLRWVRIGTVLLSLLGGIGVLFYAWLWAFVPSDAAEMEPEAPKAALMRPQTAPAEANPGAATPGHAPADPGRVPGARRVPVTEILLGLALLIPGMAIVADRLGASLPLEIIIPAVLVLLGAALAWRYIASAGLGRGTATASGAVVRTLGALVLVVLGILLFFVTGTRPSVGTVVLAALSVLAGVVIVVAPWLLRLSRELAEQRASAALSLERAEVAAHLHDSVLQTLALIQQKAETGSEAARLARAQERELREWLTTGSRSAPVDLAGSLHSLAAAIEAEYAVTVEVVAIGQTPPNGVPEEILGAAREALLNAARHAGGNISVYLEASPALVRLSITDRGPGFRLSDVPADRYGVRESIIGRLTRIGGRAELRPGPGGTGTEVRLELPVDPATLVP